MNVRQGCDGEEETPGSERLGVQLVHGRADGKGAQVAVAFGIELGECVLDELENGQRVGLGVIGHESADAERAHKGGANVGRQLVVADQLADRVAHLGVQLERVVAVAELYEHALHASGGQTLLLGFAATHAAQQRLTQRETSA